MIVKFRDWEFEVDRELTRQTYESVYGNIADSCVCNERKNYIAFRDKVFPDDVHKLFNELGIDYRKEVEMITWEILPNGLHNIEGWFHFKGRVLKGENCNVPISGGRGFTIELTRIDDNFLIGFGEGNDLTFFEDNSGLVQIVFETNIPWVIYKALEPK